jgi:hypothetical protein
VSKYQKCTFFKKGGLKTFLALFRKKKKAPAKGLPLFLKVEKPLKTALFRYFFFPKKHGFIKTKTWGVCRQNRLFLRFWGVFSRFLTVFNLGPKKVGIF